MAHVFFVAVDLTGAGLDSGGKVTAAHPKGEADLNAANGTLLEDGTAAELPDCTFVAVFGDTTCESVFATAVRVAGVGRRTDADVSVDECRKTIEDFITGVSFWDFVVSWDFKDECDNFDVEKSFDSDVFKIDFVTLGYSKVDLDGTGVCGFNEKSFKKSFDN